MILDVIVSIMIHRFISLSVITMIVALMIMPHIHLHDDDHSISSTHQCQLCTIQSQSAVEPSQYHLIQWQVCDSTDLTLLTLNYYQIHSYFLGRAPPHIS